MKITPIKRDDGYREVFVDCDCGCQTHLTCRIESECCSDVDSCQHCGASFGGALIALGFKSAETCPQTTS